jgi:hypothetical protein
LIEENSTKNHVTTTMIHTLPYYLLQGEELDTCCERIIAHITEALPAEPIIQPILPLIAKDRAALQKALANSRGSALTKKIALADEVRDDAFIAFRNICETATRRRTKPDFITAGDLLMRLIRAQGYTLQELGNSSQSGALNTLFKSLKDSAATAALTLIGAEEYLTELQDAQTEFEKILNSRTDEQAAKDYPRIASAKSALGKRLQILLDFIATLDAADLTAARPELDLLITRVNDTLTEILAPARARRSRANTPDAAPPAPPVA